MCAVGEATNGIEASQCRVAVSSATLLLSLVSFWGAGQNLQTALTDLLDRTWKTRGRSVVT